MRTLIIIFVCVSLVTACQAAEKQQKLEEIDRYIAQQRIRIENYYRGQLIELQQRAQEEIARLEVADKAVYTSLFDQTEIAKAVLHIDNFGYQAPWYLVDESEEMLRLRDEYGPHDGFRESIQKSPRWYTITQGWAAETAETTGTASATRIVDGNTTDISASGSADRSANVSNFALAKSWIDYSGYEDGVKRLSKNFVVAQSRIAERKSEILANLEWETAKLQQRRQYALTTGLALLEKRLKEDVLKPAAKEEKGLVTGIIYSSKPCAVIGGKIVHEWDEIDGVTVIKIYKDKVRFQKKGKRWDQKVQEEPAGYW